MVYETQNNIDSSTPSGTEQYSGGQVVQIDSLTSGMGDQSESGNSIVQQMGVSPGRSVCDLQQQEVTQVLLVNIPDRKSVV